ncbi:MAG TPA: DUF3417 domain-containing protein, partial [Stellaceae bacterium]|nr:DUF3417 domain-containing protein [Stellaceae bacterium]
VLVNGGLNLSVRDGWWEEAYDPEAGWAVGDSRAETADDDDTDAAALYELLEREIVPEFYGLDEAGLPRRWLARIRCSLSRLTPTYSSNRMLLDYVERLYLPAADEFRRRAADHGAAAAAMHEWERRLRHSWPRLHIGEPVIAAGESGWRVTAPVYLGDVLADDVRVEFYAEPRGTEPATVIAMQRGDPISGSVNGHIYSAAAPATRPIEDFTIRVTPARDGVEVPAELPLIIWQK